MTRRARRTLALVLLGFGLVAALEVVVLAAVGRTIGPGWTVLLLILDVVLGIAVIRRAGRRAVDALRTRLETGQLPDREVGDRGLVVVAGVLLAVPGFVSDLLALLLIVPFTRPLFRGLVAGLAVRRVGRVGAMGPMGPMGPRGPRGGSGPGDATRPGPVVVRGEVIDESED
ncbi:FxsA family protein [Pimelobacter simplex]|uniref:FxsA family protein n=1 Tax=Nocardioides simplex TaxID=2045 RepID=UPI00366C711E